MKISVIIPVYNEEKTIEEILDRVNSININKEVIIVDDGSKDGTRQILKKIEGNPLKILTHSQNIGKGAAIRTALKYITGDIVIIQDGDLEYDPRDYAVLIEPIIQKKAKVVYGSRHLIPHQKSYWRYHLGGLFLSFLTNILYKSKITDESTGYKVFSSDVLKSITLTCNKFEFCPEITAKVLRMGYKIYEVPIHYFPRSIKQGKKIRWIDGILAIWILIKFRILPKMKFDNRN